MSNSVGKDQAEYPFTPHRSDWPKPRVHWTTLRVSHLKWLITVQQNSSPGATLTSAVIERSARYNWRDSASLGNVHCHPNRAFAKSSNSEGEAWVELKHDIRPRIAKRSPSFCPPRWERLKEQEICNKRNRTEILGWLSFCFLVH